jgi:DinB superfamily
MAKFKTEDLINELKGDVHKIVASAEQMKDADKGKLVYQYNKNIWSVVQVIEHLNAYNRFYLPAIERALAERNDTRNAWFNSGFWGDYFTKMMKPTNVFEVKNRMKAMKKYSFPNSLNVNSVFNEFLEHQQKLLQLLENSRERDLNAIKVPITMSKYVKLKLGDTFRFVIAHEQRHMVQVRNTMRKVGITTNQFPVIMDSPKMQKAHA